MWQVAHGTTYFNLTDSGRVQQIMRDFNSAKRAAYQAFHKHKVEDHHDVYHILRKRYGDRLNGFYCQMAVGLARRLKDEDEVIFGGQSSWKRLLKGQLSNAEWKQCRDNLLYSSGNKSAPLGNDLIRVSGDKLLINDPAKKGKWLVGKLFIPKRWRDEVSKLVKYDAKVILDPAKQEFKIQLSWDDGWQHSTKVDLTRGSIGLDCNPDGIALVEVNVEGSLLHHHYEQNTRIQFAQAGKRQHDVRELAKRIVECAVKANKPLVIEKLAFKKQNGWRKFNRMRHNFLYAKLIEAIKSRANRRGIAVVEVNPAFTSQLGILKYQKMYSLNRHTAAALVIARRGLGLKERQDFECRVEPEGKKKDKLNLVGRGLSIASTLKAWSWLSSSFLKPNSVVLTGLELATGLKPVIGLSGGVIPPDETLTTDKSLAGSAIDLVSRELELLSSGVVQ